MKEAASKPALFETPQTIKSDYLALTGISVLMLVLPQVNDGYALGAYGLPPLAYVKFLSDRWAQLSGTEDYANF